MDRKNLRVIKGGQQAALANSRRTFRSAYVTDTRLMGVVGVHINWSLDDSVVFGDFHQFFYFDAEEYGLETYKSYMGTDSLALSLMEKSLLGNLGGKKIPLTEREAVYLVQEFVRLSRKMGQEIAEPVSEYQPILDRNINMSEDAVRRVERKMCTDIVSDYQLIHYFLMRMFGKDDRGLSFLVAEDVQLESLAESRCATLCKNSVQEYYSPEGELSYLCESLIETDSSYRLVASEVSVADGKVVSLKKRSSFAVTLPEVAMMLNRSEYITVFEILAEVEKFDEEFNEYTVGAMQTLHDNGQLYLEFNRNNDHVNRKEFRLNEDIHGLYFVSDYGQLILAAYTLEDIQDLEKRLQKSSIFYELLPTGKYQFKEPVLYEFIQSDFEDFDDFIESLQ